MDVATKKTFNFTLEADTKLGPRLDLFLRQQLPEISRTMIQHMIENGKVTINNKIVSSHTKLRNHDEVVCEVITKAPQNLDPVKMDLDILYEDEDLLVLNKPSGLTVHPGAGTANKPTLVHGLLAHTSTLSHGHLKDGKSFRPGIVHRLDKDTSGALVVAKNDFAHQALSKQFAQKTNHRQYLALLSGLPNFKDCYVEDYLYRDAGDRRKYKPLNMDTYETSKAKNKLPGKCRYAKSFFHIEKTFKEENLTLASVRLFTGRTHQIRVHSAKLNLPVVGDLIYGKPSELAKRQLLHAWILEFQHPRTKEVMMFKAPLPKDFNEILEKLLAKP